MRLNHKATISGDVAKLNPGLDAGMPPPTSYPAVPATPKNDSVTERKVHVEIKQWLRLHHIWFCESVMHKRTGSTVGTPDFMLAYKDRPVAFEVKVNGNKLSQNQELVRSEMAFNGWRYFVVSDLAGVIVALDAVLSEGEPWPD